MKPAVRQGRRVVVLGLDGVPYSLLQRFADEGVMPEVRRLLSLGTLCSMTASIPEVSSTSWSTFITGVNPGRHGIYGFMEIDRSGYSWRFPNFLDLRSRTLWEVAGAQGKRSVVINVPSTYPAKPLEGMLVSGFVALDLREASYPESFFQYLSGAGYRLDVDAGKAATAVEEFKADILRTFRKRAEVILHLHDTAQWDLFIAVVTETDRLHHYLWAALQDPVHPHHDFVVDFYRELDQFIGALYDRTSHDVPFLMLSDHGFTAVKQEVYLNYYLRERGYLKFTEQTPDSFEQIDAGSQAFALDPSRVYLHVRGRYGRGGVGPDEYESLRTALVNDLYALRVNGECVIRRVYTREELYHGPFYADAPDLVLMPHEGYDLKGSLRRNVLSGRGALTGGHTWDNALLYMNRDLSCGSPNIIDAGATVLELLGVEVEGLDGKSLI